MTADQWFQAMVLASLPAAILYPLIYGTCTRWWADWIGRGLLVTSVGLGILLGFTAAFQVLGPEYAFRNEVRNTGMAVVTVGLWITLAAMLKALFMRRPSGD